VLSSVAHMLKHKRKYDLEYRMIAADGRTVWLHQVTNVILENNEAKEIVGIAVDVSERKKAEEALRHLSGRLIQAQEEERSRIARELHDDVTQRIALLSIDLEQLQQRLCSRMECSGHLADFKSRLHELSADIHHLSRQLHPSKLQELGLTAAVESLCQESGKQKEIEVEFLHNEIPRSLPGEVALCLYRIVQEALHNVFKHSGAKSAAVEMYTTDTDVQLNVSDTGKGFDVESARAAGGLGLVSMEERLRALGGVIRIESRRSEGARIEVTLPLRATGVEDSGRIGRAEASESIPFERYPASTEPRQ
jgi:signal transduction histidine kinase